jgi:hypothetical protein
MIVTFKFGTGRPAQRAFADAPKEGTCRDLLGAWRT